MLPNSLTSARIISLVAILAAAPAQASKTCSDAAVSARGEPARFLWLAKTKARAKLAPQSSRDPHPRDGLFQLGQRRNQRRAVHHG